MRKLSFASLAAVVLLLVAPTPALHGQQNVRVATYNIKFLDTTITAQGDRLSKLQEVITLLDADVIGLQEIADRAALERVFPPSDWTILIDDDSGDDQDVAIVVRKPFTLLGVDPSLDADDANFLFPGSANNHLFPNRRDLLFAEVGMPGVPATFFVMVHHAKARVGGRSVTDPRREGAAAAIVQILDQRFHERDFVLLGDFNDNPDDRSANILETGNPFAPGGPEEDDGPFLINLADRLVAEGHVSHGRNNSDVVAGRIITIDSLSRARNNDARGTDLNTGDILFDHLLIPTRMHERYVGGSAQVFNHDAAVRGNTQNRASDHLPVFADFVFDPASPVEPATTGLQISGLLPDPAGADNSREQVTIRNATGSAISLTGWVLRDRAQNEFMLSGSVAANGTVTITMAAFTMPLNNSGDEVFLIDPEGVIRHHVRYDAPQVQPGVPISFP